MISQGVTLDGPRRWRQTTLSVHGHLCPLTCSCGPAPGRRIAPNCSCRIGVLSWQEPCGSKEWWARLTMRAGSARGSAGLAKARCREARVLYGYLM